METNNPVDRLFPLTNGRYQRRPFFPPPEGVKMIPEIPTQPMPDWISNASAPLPELCIREVLSGSVYYPACEFDGDPVKYLAGNFHSFVVAVHTPKANVQYTTLDGKPLKSVRNRHQTNTILNTSHEPKSTTVLELKYRSYDMFTIIQEFTEKYCGFRGSLFSIHPLSGYERLRRD